MWCFDGVFGNPEVVFAFFCFSVTGHFESVSKALSQELFEPSPPSGAKAEHRTDME